LMLFRIRLEPDIEFCRIGIFLIFNLFIVLKMIIFDLVREKNLKITTVRN
jgi:hypothetical protein